MPDLGSSDDLGSVLPNPASVSAASLQSQHVQGEVSILVGRLKYLQCRLQPERTFRD